MTSKVVTEYVRNVVREFQPERVVLVGSHSRGQATADSDVDLLVVMDCPGNEVDQALAIRRRVPRTFPLDLIVKTPSNLRQRVKAKDGFLCSVLKEGDVLYEAKRR